MWQMCNNLKHEIRGACEHTNQVHVERQLYEATLLAAVTHEPTSHSVLERSEFANEQRSANLSGIYDESDPILDESKD